MISIVGNGAIGNLLALRCEQLQLPYQLAVRSAPHKTITCFEQSQKTKIHPHSVNIDALDLNPRTAPRGETNSQSIQDTHSKPDLLILPLKSYQVVDALKLLKDKIAPEVYIVLLHNGMGVQELIQTILPDNPVIIATTSYGAFKPADNQLTVTGVGKTQAGWLNTKDINRQAAAMFEELLPPCEWHDDITLALWQKLAVNAVINPLTALHNIPNGDLTLAKYQQHIAQVCEEIAVVMNNLGMTTTTEQLIERSLHVARITAKNYSSMHQDLHRGRRTEINHINGYIIKQAMALNLTLPCNQSLLAQIKKKEAT